MKVLVVDDSVVFRTQIKAALEGVAEVEVVGAASNGKIALQKMKEKPVDLITLDMEMPELDGISTIRELRKTDKKTRVIVFSAHTEAGSERTLQALNEGADDFVTKPSGGGTNINNAAEMIGKVLVPKIRQFVRSRVPEVESKTTKGSSRPGAYQQKSPGVFEFDKKDLDLFKPSAVVIGSSTGGPAALETVFRDLEGCELRIPIIIVQHMPPIFTASLAKRLSSITGIPAAEAKDGEVMEKRIYVAPGDYHLRMEKEGEKIIFRLDQGVERNYVRPAVDNLFEPAAEIFGPMLMGFVLTGMGEDGRDGCVEIKKRSGGVMIQSRESCVVFGMAGKVHEAGAYDAIGGLNLISARLKKMVEK